MLAVGQLTGTFAGSSKMVTDTWQDSAQAAVTSDLRFAMGLVCKDIFTIREIDALFIFSGADEEWWIEPKRLGGSSRTNQVNGWFEGIRLRAPEQEAEIVRQVCEKLLASSQLETRHRQTVATILAKLNGTSTPAISGLDQYNLHLKVVEAAGKLFDGGHYRQAVLDTFIALNMAVKEKAARPDLDGTPMMQVVFSVKNPILSFSDDPNEQMGNMNLFAGAMAAIRNPRAHALHDNDPKVVDETLELLAFASTLFRRLDRAQKD